MGMSSFKKFLIPPQSISIDIYNPRTELQEILIYLTHNDRLQFHRNIDRAAAKPITLKKEIVLKVGSKRK